MGGGRVQMSLEEDELEVEVEAMTVCFKRR